MKIFFQNTACLSLTQKKKRLYYGHRSQKYLKFLDFLVKKRRLSWKHVVEANSSVNNLSFQSLFPHKTILNASQHVRQIFRQRYFQCVKRLPNKMIRNELEWKIYNNNKTERIAHETKAVREYVIEYLWMCTRTRPCVCAPEMAHNSIKNILIY